MFSKAAESKHQNTFHIKFRFDIEVSLFFFLQTKFRSSTP